MGATPGPITNPIRQLLPFLALNHLGAVRAVPINHGIDRDTARSQGQIQPTVRADLSLPTGSEARCRERACVFPAGPAGLCLHHSRLQREPELYQSRQPTLLVVERSRYEVDAEDEHGELTYNRGTDRRRLAAERQAFLEG